VIQRHVYQVLLYRSNGDLWYRCSVVQIPTIVAYKRGKPIGYGVDAIEQADAQDGELAKWFKVSLTWVLLRSLASENEYG
jgi:hypothetical protein